MRPLTTVHVVASDNTFLTSTSARSYDLSASTGQFTIFREGGSVADHAPATAANIGSSTPTCLYTAQGRKEDTTTDGQKLGTKKSDKIYLSKVKNWYKVIAEDTVRTQVTKVSGFDGIKPDEHIALTLRLRSNYIDAAYNQSVGLMRTLSVLTGCPDCGADPCDEVTAAEIEAMVDDFVTAGNADEKLTPYLTFYKEIPITVADASTFQADEAVTCTTGDGTGTVVSANTTTDVVIVRTQSDAGSFTGNLTPAAGAASAISSVDSAAAVIAIVAKTPTDFAAINRGNNHFTNETYEWDKVYFETYVYRGGENTMDELVADRCDPTLATVTVTQRPTFPRGASAEAKQIEKFNWANNSDVKTYYDDKDWNGAYTSSIVDGTYYDQYWLEYIAPNGNSPWVGSVDMTNWVCILTPTGGAAATTIEAILEAALGTCKDASSDQIS